MFCVNYQRNECNIRKHTHLPVIGNKNESRTGDPELKKVPRTF